MFLLHKIPDITAQMLVVLYRFQSYWFAVPSSSRSCINKDIKCHNKGFFTLTEHRFDFFFFAPQFGLTFSFSFLSRFFQCFPLCLLKLALLFMGEFIYRFIKFRSRTFRVVDYSINQSRHFIKLVAEFLPRPCTKSIPTPRRRYGITPSLNINLNMGVEHQIGIEADATSIERSDACFLGGS